MLQFYYKIQQLLQNATFIAKCIGTPVNTDQIDYILPMNTNTREHQRNSVAMSQANVCSNKGFLKGRKMLDNLLRQRKKSG